MKRFQTRNPGEFKRKKETSETNEIGRFTLAMIIISLTCFGLLLGRWVGAALYPILKSLGVFS